MRHLAICFVVISSVFLSEVLVEASCPLGSNNGLKLSMTLEENTGDEWTPIFMVDKYVKRDSDNIELKIVRRVTSCGKGTRQKIDGNITEWQTLPLAPENYEEPPSYKQSRRKEKVAPGGRNVNNARSMVHKVNGMEEQKTLPPTQEKEVKLAFHPRSGSNAQVAPGGRKASNVGSSFGYAIVLTNRPLKRNELFQVKATNFFNIGVTKASPDVFKFPKYMGSSRDYQNVTWTWELPHRILHGGSEKHYKTPRLYKQKSDVLGVRVMADNSLHFYQNGNDAGDTKAVITGPVYGFIELYSNSVAEIV